MIEIKGLHKAFGQNQVLKVQLINVNRKWKKIFLKKGRLPPW